jgi:hypothetical protein
VLCLGLRLPGIPYLKIGGRLLCKDWFHISYVVSILFSSSIFFGFLFWAHYSTVIYDVSVFGFVLHVILGKNIKNYNYSKKFAVSKQILSHFPFFLLSISHHSCQVYSSSFQPLFIATVLFLALSILVPSASPLASLVAIPSSLF